VSERPDKESKTEAPSEKRLRDAIEKGNVPFSSEAGIFTSFAAIAIVCMLLAGNAVGSLSRKLAYMLEFCGQFEFQNASDAIAAVRRLSGDILLLLLPVIVVLTLGGLLGPAAQNTPQANLERLVPKPERLNPLVNLKRIYGKRAFFEFAKTLIKVVAVTSVCFWSLGKSEHAILLASTSDVGTVPTLIVNTIVSVLWPLTLVSMVIAIADVAVSRLRWREELMMSRQELKDEYKQMEGDPHIKEKIKSLARQRAKRRMMADVPRATLVVTNPTHYAIALRYVQSEGGAPLVIAKGTDAVALRIRELCELNGIAVAENRELARALYPAVEVGQMIPSEFYRAVAEVIHFVNMKNAMNRGKLIQA
jgi:flagellar biosynthetic protein FlhB